jgi:hypothetical protein
LACALRGNGDFVPFLEAIMALFSQMILCLFVGFAVSYGFSWLFRAVQDPETAARFDLPQGVRQAATLGLLFAAGAFVLAQETAAAQNRGEWPESYLAGGYALSALWSAALGFAVTQVLIG